MFPTAWTPLARLIAAVVGVLLIIGAFWLAMHFYGKHRYDEGVSAERAAWQAASDKLKQDAGNAADHATANAVANEAVHDAQQSADQNAVSTAEKNGTSPLDALFGN